MLHLNVYEIDQCYGGPEEGGWYYSAGLFHKCIGTFTDTDEGRKNAEAAKKVFRIAEKENKRDHRDYKMGHGAHDGVDPDGEADDRYMIPGGAWGYGEVRAVIQDHEGRNFPETRPYYS